MTVRIPPASAPGSARGPAPSLAAVATVTVDLGEPLDFGRTRDGLRRITPILGGELRGIPGSDAGEALRGLRAAILPGGGDRQLVRPDGTVEIDARYDARAAGGSLIGLHATGLRRAPGPDEVGRSGATGAPGAPGAPGEPGATGASGDSPGVRGRYFRVALRFETSDPALAELQEALFIADGAREADRVVHTVYRVS